MHVQQLSYHAVVVVHGWFGVMLLEIAVQVVVVVVVAAAAAVVVVAFALVAVHTAVVAANIALVEVDTVLAVAAVAAVAAIAAVAAAMSEITLAVICSIAALLGMNDLVVITMAVDILAQGNQIADEEMVVQMKAVVVSEVTERNGGLVVMVEHKMDYMEVEHVLELYELVLAHVVAATAGMFALASILYLEP